MRGCFLILIVLPVLSGCAVTRFSVSLAENPIPRIAEGMRGEGYAIKVTEDCSRIELRDTWLIHSFFSTGWTRYVIWAKWEEGKLTGWAFLRIQSLQNLLIPQYVDLGPEFFGSLLKPAMWKELRSVWAAGGIDRKAVRYWHGVDRKEMKSGG